MESKIKEFFHNMDKKIKQTMHTTRIQNSVGKMHRKQYHEHSDNAISKNGRESQLIGKSSIEWNFSWNFSIFFKMNKK